MAKKVSDKKAQLKKEAFLQAYSTCGNISKAARLSKIRRQDHYDWLKNSKTYQKRFDEAEDEAIDMLEEEARRRAIRGVRKPVGWHRGVPGGYVKEYSDTLLIFLLKAARPNKFRDNASAESVGAEPPTIIFQELAPGQKPQEEESEETVH